MIFSLSSREACKVRFENRTGEEIAVYWASYSGCLHRYARVAPGATAVQESFVGHPWTFAGFASDSPMACEGRDVYYALPGNCTCVVERPPALEWSPATHHKFPGAFKDAVAEVLLIYSINRVKDGAGAMDAPAELVVCRGAPLELMQMVPEECPPPPPPSSLSSSPSPSGKSGKAAAASLCFPFAPERSCCYTAPSCGTNSDAGLSVGLLQSLPPNCIELILRYAAPRVDKIHRLRRRDPFGQDVVWRVERRKEWEAAADDRWHQIDIEDILDSSRTRLDIEVDGEVIEGTLGERRYLVDCVHLINASRTEATRINEVSVGTSQTAGRTTIYVDAGRFPEPTYSGQRGVIVTAHQQDPVDQVNGDNTSIAVTEFGPLRADATRLDAHRDLVVGEGRAEGDEDWSDGDENVMEGAAHLGRQGRDVDTVLVTSSDGSEGAPDANDDMMDENDGAEQIRLPTYSVTQLEDRIQGGNMPRPSTPSLPGVLLLRVLGGQNGNESGELGDGSASEDLDDAEVEGFIEAGATEMDEEGSDFESDEEDDPFSGPGAVRYVGGSMSLFVRNTVIVLVYSTIYPPASTRRRARSELRSAMQVWAP